MEINFIDANDVWDSAQDFCTGYDDGYYEVIAENTDYGTEVGFRIEHSYPVIVASADAEEVYNERVFSRQDCAETVARVVEEYLSKDVMGEVLKKEFSKSEEDKFDYEDHVADIELRERELSDAVFNLMDEFVPNLYDIVDDGTEVIDDLQEHICEYLYIKYGISVYRPMFLEDEDGNDVFLKYPYPEMELEDD